MGVCVSVSVSLWVRGCDSAETCEHVTQKCVAPSTSTNVCVGLSWAGCRSTGCWHRSRRSDCPQVRHYVISVAGSTMLEAAGEPIRFRWQAILQALVPAHTLLLTLILASALGYQAPYYVFSAQLAALSYPCQWQRENRYVFAGR